MYPDVSDNINSGFAQMSLVKPFKSRMKVAIEEGLLLFTKYSLVVLLAWLALMYGTNVVNGAVNGTQAALYLNELQNKGYLPKVVNGTVPSKESNEATNSK